MTGNRNATVTTRKDIVTGLQGLGICTGDGLFIHSSLSALGHVDGGPEAVVDALLDTVGVEGTVAVPTFTWGRNHAEETVRFDVQNDPSEVGNIPGGGRQRPEAARDEHVCHSIAAIGPRAGRVLGDGIRPFAQGSGMYRVYEHDFWYVFLGCDFGCCTALHTAEELASVPYRYYRHFRGSTLVRADGTEVAAKSIEFLRKEPYRNDFGKMEGILSKKKLLRTAKVGAATLLCAKARDIVESAVAALGEDIGFLLSEASREYLRYDSSK